MKKLLLILLCLPMIGFGQNVNIPDANFKAYLVGNTAINTNGDTEIQVSEAAVFNGSINCNNMNISDLTGIEDFISLPILNCGDNQLTSLDISNNPNLVFLTCYNNNLSTLDLRNGNNPQIDSVWTYGNPNLTCISVDDSIYSSNNWTGIAMMDSQHFFSNNCPTFIFGCIDSLACNYNPLATIDDSSCAWSVSVAMNVSACDSFMFGNSVCDSSGAYINTFTMSNGCDSTVLLALNIFKSTSSYDTLSSINAFVWNGNTLNLSGDYSDTLINSAGCDSIANLNLTITNTTGLLDVTNTEKTLLKITDILGQETPYKRNTPLFYIYDDGTVEKRIVIE